MIVILIIVITSYTTELNTQKSKLHLPICIVGTNAVPKMDDGKRAPHSARPCGKTSNIPCRNVLV